MAGWNGTGTFTGPTYVWVNDLNAGIPITALRVDTNDTDYTTGINACMAKNGENSATGNLNIGGFRLTSVGNATARTDAIPAGQLQDGGSVYVASAGTNTITATLAPAITVYANGQTFAIKAANTTTAAATLAFNGLSALNIYYSDGTTQLLAGAIIQNNIYWMTYDSSLNSSAGGFICLNPSPINSSYTGTITGGTTSPTATITVRISADGSMCTLIPGTGLAITSNATTCTVTGGPSIIQPAQTQSFYMSLEDATAAAAGSVTMTAGSGVITLGKGVSFGAGGFTASGTKAWANGGTSSAGATVIYSLK